MHAARSRAAAYVLLAFLLVPASARTSSDVVDASGVAPAYGTVVDSITVTGNRSTQSFVFLREMETRVGHVLEPDIIQRDMRFISDMSPVAKADFQAEVIAPGHCILRIRIEERNTWFLTSLLPFLKYDFETGITYGARAKDKNFRGRLEQVEISYTRNERGDNDVAFTWGTPWIGWKHISVLGQLRYYNRGDVPREVETLESTRLLGSLGIPLTDSRIHFAQMIGSLALSKNINGNEDDGRLSETVLSPTIGFRYDGRDSGLRPTRGQAVLVNTGNNIPLDVERGTSYWLRVRGRSFHGRGEKHVLALLSDLYYQYGDFPDYSLIYLGGSGTLRGHPDSRFSGSHRWFGTVEWRYLYLPRRLVPVPVFKQVDVGLALVTFIDTGIVWRDRDDFRWESLHGSGGFGVRFYTPLRDVFRMDFGFTRGDARVHIGTGIRF